MYEKYLLERKIQIKAKFWREQNLDQVSDAIRQNIKQVYESFDAQHRASDEAGAPSLYRS